MGLAPDFYIKIKNIAFLRCIDVFFYFERKRPRSSAGLEHLPSKQRVTGSSPVEGAFPLNSDKPVI